MAIAADDKHTIDDLFKNRIIERDTSRTQILRSGNYLSERIGADDPYVLEKFLGSLHKELGIAPKDNYNDGRYGRIREKTNNVPETVVHNVGTKMFLDMQKSLQTVADYIAKIPGKIKGTIEKIYDTPKSIVNRLARYTSAISLGRLPRGVRNNYEKEGYRNSKHED